MTTSKLTLASGALWISMLAGCGGGGSGASGNAEQSPPTQMPSPAPQTPQPSDPSDLSRQDAVRLLEQATFGPTRADVAKVMSIGVEAYVDQQLAIPKTGYVGLTRTGIVQGDDCKTQPNDPTSAASLCARTHYSLFELQRQFFANALSGEDQLRQRVAFALSQVFVVSGTEVKHAAGMATAISRCCSIPDRCCGR